MYPFFLLVSTSNLRCHRAKFHSAARCYDAIFATAKRTSWDRCQTSQTSRVTSWQLLPMSSSWSLWRSESLFDNKRLVFRWTFGMTCDLMEGSFYEESDSQISWIELKIWLPFRRHFISHMKSCPFTNRNSRCPTDLLNAAGGGINPLASECVGSFVASLWVEVFKQIFVNRHKRHTRNSNFFFYSNVGGYL